MLMNGTGRRRKYRTGFSLIDVVVGVALMLILFLALFGVLRASLLVSSLARAKAGSTTIAETQMEYLRSLSYDLLGTVGGIPPGIVTQDTQAEENGITYAIHTFIGYRDDPADGTGQDDTNGIITDYKRAEVTVSYTVGGQTKFASFTSNFSPPGLETTVGGGTLEVAVVNAAGSPVPDASVAITNTAISPAVDIATFTGLDGIVSLPGAATSSAYQISISKSEYSSAQTYARDATNQNPNPGYLTVATNQTTVGTFAIDLLSTFSLATFSPIATSTFTDTFADDTKITAMDSVSITDGTLALANGATTGSARAVTVHPAHLVHWGEVSATLAVPTDASAALHIYDASGNLLPDSALPGNTEGFPSFPVSLFAVSTTTYPSLALGASLSTSADSPSLFDWSLSYTDGPTPLPNVTFTLTGAKTIGSTGDGSPLYKTTATESTGTNAQTSLTIEEDRYTLGISGYDIVDACPAPPYALAPGTLSFASLVLGTATTNSLRVLVSNNEGAAVDGALVTLSRAGFSEDAVSSSCGAAYFSGITSASNYTLTIAKTGYTTIVLANVSVAGPSTYSANFP
ncbi:MAG: carboxypeptidase-like regulatory domain-containing protein [Patescibacteria group bacterium]|nr:carboxypeptidase-like regulatory domain-containing protein [Patescibacteria group bacterium]